MNTTKKSKKTTGNSINPLVIKRFRAVEKATEVLLTKGYGKTSLLMKLERLAEALGVETSL
jgi:hypothetical protein